MAGNYAVLSDIPSNLDRYVKDKLGESAQTLYEDFWREAFTRRHMPDPSFVGGGLKDIPNMGKTGSSGSMEIKENGVGIFRYVINQSVIPKDDTALARSFWFEATPSNVIGDVYCFPGISPADRPSREPTPLCYVNPKDNALKEALVPFKAGETLGLVVYFKSIPPADANLKVNILPTSIKWDNQKDIEEKVSNATLTGKDKLKFTPALPKTRPGDPKFTAVVLLNNNEEYKTEIDKVEDGKTFEVAAPMKELPPSSVSVNIKILRDNKLVHEYQSGEVTADAKVYIEGPRMWYMK